MNAKRLAAVFLVDSHPSAFESHAVVTLCDERGDLTDQAPVGTRRRQAHTAGELETEVLVLGKAIEVVRDRLEDVSRRCAPLRDSIAITAGIVEERGFRLRAGERELPLGRTLAYRTGIRGKIADAPGGLGFIQPLHCRYPAGGVEHRVQALLAYELHGAGAILPDMCKERDGVSRRDLK